MDVTPLVPAGRQLVQGYGDGGFTIAGVRWEGSVLVFPEETRAWPVAAAADLTPASLAAVVAAGPRPDILVLGCGGAPAKLDPALRPTLRAAGIVVEAMATAAACRTYNILLAEGRRVAAALIAV